MIVTYLKATLWRLIHPRAIQCDLARHIMRMGATQTGRARR